MEESMRYLITGGSGYIGTRLTELLSAREETERIVNLDVRTPTISPEKTSFVRGDVRDFQSIRSLLEREEIDCLIHLAFILDPIRDEARMYDVDVNGTVAVLRAAAEAGTPQMLVTSSATAYGAFPDNPKPIAEDWLVRGAPDFAYARDKADMDRACQLWAAQHHDRVMTIVRPCIVFGPNCANYIVRAWENQPFFPHLDGVDEEFQLVHEDDLVAGLVALLDKREDGAFNIAGDGTMTWREGAEIIGTKVRRMSFRMAYTIAKWSWRLRLPRTEAPPGNLHFIRYPWVVSNEKLKTTTGWEPQYETRETFELTMRSRGVLGAEGGRTPIESPVSGPPVA
jgi:UDP-glucose 4-epimerase